MRSFVFFTCFSLAACAASTSNDEPDLATASTEEAIVGGTAVANTVRSEIGRVYSPGGACTGTLIAPDVVLTAAHCLSPSYTQSTPAPQNTFRAWEPGTGQGYPYPVNRLHSFGVHDGDDDIALYHLGFMVPDSVATPAVLAHAYPQPGASSDVWGFGCVDRPTGGGSGVKRYQSFNYGSATTLLCDGDSGGPVYGPVQGQNAVWGVSSSYDNPAGNPSGSDHFGDVPAHKYPIELVMRQWRSDARLELDVDRPGADYKVASMKPTGAADCLAMCDRDAGCHAFTYDAPAPGASVAYCHLKSAVTDWVPSAGHTSGLPMAQEPGTDRFGNDYRELDLPDARQELCYAECARDPKCASYAYAASLGAFHKHCWLKSAAGNDTGNSLVVSGAKRSFEIGIDRAGPFAGDDYSVFDATSGAPSECATICSYDSACRAFTFAPAWSEGPHAKCHLKKYAFDPVARAAYVSGVKRGLEMNTIRPGGAYKTFTQVLDPRPEVCQSACAGDPSCQSWTMAPPTPTAPAQCELKSTVRPSTKATNYVSGIKGGEFFGADAPY